jgi:hypothetical protein
VETMEAGTGHRPNFLISRKAVEEEVIWTRL